jgi:hypothetical protein
MSYDLAVWVGDVPESDVASLAEYTRRMDALEAAIEGDAEAEAHPRLLTFADALLARYPDLDDDNEDATPWADAPLKNNIVGDLFYFAMAPSHADAAIPFIVETASSHGLVCFDPQTESLLPPPRSRTPRSRRWFKRS